MGALVNLIIVGISSKAGYILGFLAAALINIITWRMRERRLTLTAILGAFNAVAIIGITVMFLSSPYVGEIHEPLIFAVAALVLGSVVLGILHARALQASFWATMFAVFLEAGAALILGAATAKVRDWLIVNRGYEWQLLHEPYNDFIIAMVIVLLVLSIIRPLIRIRRRRRNPYGYIF